MTLVDRLVKKFFPFFQLGYSQEGEDLLLARIFLDRKTGFYVDVGAHHPKRFSNTYKFYVQGWHGINIDPTPGAMAAFNRVRPRDQNLELAVSDLDGEMEFYLFNEPALNTSDPELAREREQSGYYIEKKVQVPVRTLKSILSENLPSQTDIDFLSVDVEGKDLQVLKSNDWDRYRPQLVLVEILNTGYWLTSDSEIQKYLESVDYRLLSKTLNTYFFLDSRSKKNII